MAINYNQCEQEFIDKGYDSDRAYEICLDREIDESDEEHRESSSDEEEKIT